MFKKDFHCNWTSFINASNSSAYWIEPSWQFSVQIFHSKFLHHSHLFILYPLGKHSEIFSLHASCAWRNSRLQFKGESLRPARLSTHCPRETLAGRGRPPAGYLDLRMARTAGSSTLATPQDVTAWHPSLPPCKLLPNHQCLGLSLPLGWVQG